MSTGKEGTGVFVLIQNKVLQKNSRAYADGHFIDRTFS